MRFHCFRLISDYWQEPDRKIECQDFRCRSNTPEHLSRQRYKATGKRLSNRIVFSLIVLEESCCFSQLGYIRRQKLTVGCLKTAVGWL